MIRVLVVDDHPIVRQGLVSLLEDDPGSFEVVGAVESAEAALPLVTARQPDVILLDLELPGQNGVAAIPGFLEAHPTTGVLVFTAYDTDERVVGAMRAGARGYLLKGAPADEIARAIRIVAGGGSYLEPRVASALLSELRGAHPVLTPREREVLRLVADGLSNKQIARQLSVSERTVKFHVASLFRKLGADNRAQAVALGLKDQL